LSQPAVSLQIRQLGDDADELGFFVSTLPFEWP
jgi:hypothetical protein